jgi:hypothetical protein
MAALFPRSPAMAEGPVPDLDYRVTVLVRDLESGEDFPEAGRVAAEALALALEKAGMVRAVRPKYAEREEVGLGDAVVEVNDADGRRGARGRRDVDIVVSTQKTTKRYEVSAPESDYILEGRALALEGAWRLSAELRNRPTNTLDVVGLYGEAEGDKALTLAADRLASQLSNSLSGQVLERRAEAIRRAVTLEMMDRGDAMKRLADMYDRAYRGTAVVPAAVALVLASEKLPADDPVVLEWRAKVQKHFSPGAARLLKRLGLDPNEFAAPQEVRAPTAAP